LLLHGKAHAPAQEPARSVRSKKSNQANCGAHKGSLDRSAKPQEQQNGWQKQWRDPDEAGDPWSGRTKKARHPTRDKCDECKHKNL
jgi:hypothetical protein